MKLIEITPFVRFAYSISLKSKSRVMAQDCRIFYFYNGSGVVNGKNTVEVDGKSYEIGEGSIMLLQAYQPYCFHFSSSSSKVISINFDYTCHRSTETAYFSVVSPEDAVPEGETLFFEDCPLLNKPIVCRGNHLIATAMESIVQEFTAQQPYYRESISGIMKKCITEIVRLASSPSDRNLADKLQNVIDFIHTNYDKAIDNETLAQLTGYHPYYLNKLFRTAMGITLHQYLIQYRISVSQGLLISSRRSVKDISASVGFSNPLSFAACFKKKHGISPTEYRAKFTAE